jgi:hypothetical protein
LNRSRHNRTRPDRTAFWRPLTSCLILVAALAGASCGDQAPDPPPDRDKLYSLFERAADFAVVLDRLDIVCAPVGEGDRVGWVTDRSHEMLDPDEQARLAAFIADRHEAVFENYRKEFCGMEVSTEQSNYVAAYKVHRARLESAIEKAKGARAGAKPAPAP